jgi:hypothetical protein
MSNSAKKEYLLVIRKRYFLATKAEKSLILDELCTVCKFNRKYAIRVLAKKQTSHNKKKGLTKIFNSLDPFVLEKTMKNKIINILKFYQ